MFRWKTERNTKYYRRIRHNRLNGRSESERTTLFVVVWVDLSVTFPQLHTL